MFVSGKLIDNDDPSIENFCFIPILKHNFGADNTWYLGSPILNDYYTVFDMSPGSYLQIGISMKNDESNDAFYNFEGDAPPKPLDEKWIVIGGVIFMALVTMTCICCKKKRQVKEGARAEGGSLMSDDMETPGQNIIN